MTHKYKIDERVVSRSAMKTPMTIIEINSDGSYKCTWKDKKTKKEKEKDFLEEELMSPRAASISFE